ncbi:hypothetical protein AVEN_77392-1 [Araneus ventricosus]|uniref:CCHC-type domain-containing protein n=1 Tax=Araneus ventricosus TaxID=182803 RepID=A0A4Y2C816_ARAVE|nr:hypothetical protein AVEN_77392-1 [Araneus ventricosus]
MVSESRAAGLISSFPSTTENYSKAIQQLKARFDREDLLVQIYVRDLLSLVIENAVAVKSSPDLATLYDMLETKLRALESFGRTKEKFADFLEPLVESCLPEIVLRAWERSRISGVADDCTSQRSLEKLMSFLRHEVESEEMIKLTREGFVKNGGSFKRNKSAILDTTDTATTAMLVSTTSSYVGTSTNKKNCVFCRKLHWSSECLLAQNMSYNDKKRILYKNRFCFKCIRYGHVNKKCMVKVKCLKCNRQHATLMCPGKEEILPFKANESSKVASNLSNNFLDKVYLQTVYVEIVGQGNKMRVRGLLDSASSRSYVSDGVVNYLKLRPLRHEKMIHGLFGGKETRPIEHGIYAVEIQDLNGSVGYCCEVFSERKICVFVPKIEDPQILDNLRVNNIELSDVTYNENEIDLLIGADLIGKLLTGSDDYPVMDSVQTVLSLYVNNASLRELWDIESLGIREPIKNVSKRKAFVQQLKEFHEN